MAFEKLFFKPNSELELINLITAEVQSRFEELRGRFFYLKVDLVNLEQSQIVWEKELESKAALKDFFYDTEKIRSHLAIRFDEDSFEAIMSGFCVCARFQIYPERMVMEDPYIHSCSPDKENHPMVPRDVLEGAFGCLAEQFTERSEKKAV
jgi:hypothetical protein